jgi:hypothetical protein
MRAAAAAACQSPVLRDRHQVCEPLEDDGGRVRMLMGADPRMLHQVVLRVGQVGELGAARAEHRALRGPCFNI